MAVLLLVTSGEIVEGASDVGMTRGKLLLRQRQRPLELRFGLGIAELALIERREIVELGGDVDGVDPDRLLHDGERAHVERLGLRGAGGGALELWHVFSSAR